MTHSKKPELPKWFKKAQKIMADDGIGAQVLRRIRASEELQHVHIAVVTDQQQPGAAYTPILPKSKGPLHELWLHRDEIWDEVKTAGSTARASLRNLLKRV